MSIFRVQQNSNWYKRLEDWNGTVTPENVSQIISHLQGNNIE